MDGVIAAAGTGALDHYVAGIVDDVKIVAGTARLVAALSNFRFGDPELEIVSRFLDDATVEWLRDYRFGGDIDGYREGDFYFPGSPILSVRGTFAECVLLETLILSILNHDSAIASAAARMVSAADGRPMIEMGSRRTHEESAVAASRIDAASSSARWRSSWGWAM